MSKIEQLCNQLGLTEEMLEMVVKGRATLEYRHCCFLIPKEEKSDVEIPTISMPDYETIPTQTAVQPAQNITDIAIAAHEQEVNIESTVEEVNDMPEGFSSNIFEASENGIIDSASMDNVWPDFGNNDGSNVIKFDQYVESPQAGSETRAKRTEDPDWMKNNW